MTVIKYEVLEKNATSPHEIQGPPSPGVHPRDVDVYKCEEQLVYKVTTTKSDLDEDRCTWSVESEKKLYYDLDKHWNLRFYAFPKSSLQGYGNLYATEEMKYPNNPIADYKTTRKKYLKHDKSSFMATLSAAKSVESTNPTTANSSFSVHASGNSTDLYFWINNPPLQDGLLNKEAYNQAIGQFDLKRSVDMLLVSAVCSYPKFSAFVEQKSLARNFPMPSVEILPYLNEGTVICTELHRQGLLSDEIYEADALYGKTKIDAETLKNYQAWGTEVAKMMAHSSLVTKLVRPFATAWAEQMAFEMGVLDKPNRLGQALVKFGTPVSNLFGGSVRKVKEATRE